MDVQDEAALMLASLPDVLKRRILSIITEQNQDDPVPKEATLCKDSATARTDWTTSISVGKSESWERLPVAALPLLTDTAYVVENFISKEHALAAQQDGVAALEEKQRQARMGGGVVPWKDTQARGDVARWLHLDEEQASGRKALAGVIQAFMGVRQSLSDQGFDVGGRSTFQLACYPGNGTRYVRHADRSDSAPTRRVTAIVYLNTSWDIQNSGGHLALYNSQGSYDKVGWQQGEPATLIAPLGGRLVVFESHVEHEVLPAHQHRWAVTAWFHCAKPQTASCQDTQEASCQDTQQGSCQSTDSHNAHATKGQPELILGQSEEDQEEGQAAGQTNTQPAEQLNVARPTNMHQNSSLTQALITQQEGVLETPSCRTSDQITSTAAAADEQTQQGVAGQQPGIFVSIASYRDPETQWTMKDLLDKAAYPDRIRIGVVWQVDQVHDAHFVRLAGTACLRHLQEPQYGSPPDTTAGNTSTSASCDARQAQQRSDSPQVEEAARRLKQIRQVVLPASEATGPCKARYLAATLLEDERYYLQIDSHMRFVQGWDELLIQQLHAAEDLAGVHAAQDANTAQDVNTQRSAQLQNTAQSMHPRGVVLTTYPQNYDGEGPHAIIPDANCSQPILLCASQFDSHGMLRTKGRMLAKDADNHLHAMDDATGDKSTSHSTPTDSADNVSGGGVSYGRAWQVWRRKVLATRTASDPLPCLGWAAGFSFSRSHVMQSAAAYPPPHTLPHLFFGEESYIWSRLWTHGYEVFSPGKVICFHQWHRATRSAQIRPLQPAPTQEDVNDRIRQQDQSRKLVHSVLQSSSCASLKGQQGGMQHVGVIMSNSTCMPQDSKPQITTECVGACSTAQGVAAAATTPLAHAEAEHEVSSVVVTPPVGFRLGEQYGLGRARSITQLAEATGVDLAHGCISKHGNHSDGHEMHGPGSCWLPKQCFQ